MQKYKIFRNGDRDFYGLKKLYFCALCKTSAMKHILFISISFLGICAAVAQVQTGSFWHDGSCYYQATVNADSVIFVGGNLHEGGWMYNMLQTDTGYVFMNYEFKDVVYKAGFQQITDANGEHNVLVMYSSKDNPCYVLIQYDGTGKDVFDARSQQDLRSILEYDLHQMWEGKYLGDNGKEYLFTPGKMVMKTAEYPMGLPLDYQIEYEMDFPKPLILLSNGERLWLCPTITGMDIFKADFHSEADGEYEWWSKSDSLIASLKKVESTTTQPGRWPFASTHILTSGMLKHYSKEDLYWMLNEIYARHGYRFTDKKQKFFFKEQSWYKAIPKHKRAPLTPLEQLNVELIKNFD